MIKQYINEAKKQYHLRLKTIVPLDDEQMDKIEMMVAKYIPTSISRPNKTILQRQPLDFPNLEAAEVYIVDMTFDMPIAPHILRADIRKVLDAPENFVFVRTRAEPGELQSEIINAMAEIKAEAEKKGLVVAAMLNDPDYNEAESVDHSKLYGNEYNASLLGYLGQIEKEREDAVVRVKTAPFTWLDLPDRKDQEPVQDDSNFNAHIKDAPLVAPPASSNMDVDYSIFGNFNPENHEIRQVYKDKKGNRVVLTRKLKGAE
jgi:hypothetical protein